MLKTKSQNVNVSLRDQIIKHSSDSCDHRSTLHCFVCNTLEVEWPLEIEVEM